MIGHGEQYVYTYLYIYVYIYTYIDIRPVTIQRTVAGRCMMVIQESALIVCACDIVVCLVVLLWVSSELFFISLGRLRHLFGSLWADLGKCWAAVGCQGGFLGLSGSDLSVFD